MCCYGLYGPYKSHYACFACQKAFKWPRDARVEPRVAPPVGGVRCPECTGPMTAMGLDFKAPPRARHDQWEKVRRLAEAGIFFGSCGDGGPGRRPRRLGEVTAFLESEVALGEGDRLGREFRRRRERRPSRARGAGARGAPRQPVLFRARVARR